MEPRHDLGGGPYRAHAIVEARAPRWWAGAVGGGTTALGVVAWIVTGVAAYGSESAGMGASLVAAPVTAFGVACGLVARRTRYARGVSARILAPLASGYVAALASFGLLATFFLTLWGAL